jgi:predicted membrane chloride channel (bestrophin family)
MDPVTGDLERRAYRVTVERLLDLALRLRAELARDAGEEVLELAQRVRELGRRVARQRTELLDRDEAAVAPFEERLRHIANIMRECEAILAEQSPEPGAEPS